MNQDTSPSEWNKIQAVPGRYLDARTLVLTNGKPGFYPAGRRFDFSHDISVYVHSPMRIDFYGRILELDADFSIGEYETERATLLACSFRNSSFICGKDYRMNKPVSLEEAKLLIPLYLDISRGEFLKLFQLSGMTETCRQGIRELLE